MKYTKLMTALLTMAMLLAFISGIPVLAASSATLTGPSTVRAGDTITLTFNVNGTNIYGLEGAFSYDSSLVTLASMKQKMTTAWSVTSNGNHFSGYDIAMNAPISKNTAVLTATFKVKSSVATGTKITISVKNVVLTVAQNGNVSNLISEEKGTVSYSATIAAPKSTDATLKSLTVNNAELSPAFSADTTKYTASVDYSVSKLDISAVTNHSKGEVSISGNSLKVGSNTVKITVTAESGATKVYSITVTRAQDPNYVASSNADLKGITVSQGILSPTFDAQQTEYIVYLPYEITTFSAAGTALDSKASVTATGEVALKVGENKTTILITAENGTQKAYHITVMRMQELGAQVPDTTTPTPGQTEETTPTPMPTETTVPTVSAVPTATEVGSGQQGATQREGMPIWIWILLLVVAFGVGLGTGIIVMKKKG